MEKQLKGLGCLPPHSALKCHLESYPAACRHMSEARYNYLKVILSDRCYLNWFVSCQPPSGNHVQGIKCKQEPRVHFLSTMFCIHTTKQLSNTEKAKERLCWIFSCQSGKQQWPHILSYTTVTILADGWRLNWKSSELKEQATIA